MSTTSGDKAGGVMGQFQRIGHTNQQDSSNFIVEMLAIRPRAIRFQHKLHYGIL
ncbi:MAG TPA: hypothetical protein VK040_10085 [Balneolaceae bacterium]|nr:hypothetical protein [Balneolaceae bacterium]